MKKAKSNPDMMRSSEPSVPQRLLRAAQRIDTFVSYGIPRKFWDTVDKVSKKKPASKISTTPPQPTSSPAGLLEEFTESEISAVSCTGGSKYVLLTVNSRV